MTSILHPLARRRDPNGLRWWGLLDRRPFLRHPVSLTRQRAGTTLLVLVFLGFATYSIRTRDEAIRQRAVSFLEQATGGEVEVGRARFRMFQGITLENVRISVPFDTRLDPTSVDFNSRNIFSARSLQLVHDPWHLVFGALSVEQIVAVQPTIRLVQNVDTGLRNWQLLKGPDRSPAGGGADDRPLICLRSAKAVVVSVYADGSRERREEELDADMRPHPRSETGYCIEVRRFSEPSERTTVILDPGARLVTNTPFVDARTVRLQLPKLAQQVFDRIDMNGEVKLSRLVYDPKAPLHRDTELRLRRVHCTIPLSMLGSQPAPARGQSPADEPSPPGQVGLELTDVRGGVNLTGGRLDLDISGLVNDAQCSIKGRLEGEANALDEVGVELEISATGLPAPEGPLRERILKHPDTPFVLRSIFEDYDPRGLFDLSLRMRRPAGPAGRLQVSGVVRPQGARGEYSGFAYPLEGLSGTILFDPPLVTLQGLTGTHDSGRLQIDANIDQSRWWADIGVDIQATDVPLDQALYDALPEDYRALWRRFGPAGKANIKVELRRPAALESDPDPQWNTRVLADLVDAQVIFDAYPYPLANVGGKLQIDAGRIDVVGLSGRHGEARISLEGHAVTDPALPPEADFRLVAESMRLDDSLAAALPPEGRGAFEQFQPEGSVDLSGTIRLDDPEHGMRYDLSARVFDGAICYRSLPYRIDRVNGEILIRPEGFSVMQISGSHGDARFRARGDIHRFRQGYVADLVFEGEDVALDADLHEALPPSLKAVWGLLQPRGRMKVRTSLHRASRPDGTDQRHRTELEATDVSICLRPFPLRLTGVAAKTVVTDRGLEIISMRGQAGGGKVDLCGRIDLTGPGQRGALTIHAEDIVIDDALIEALPSGIRESIVSMNPVGTFDLVLDPLVFEIDSQQRIRWDLTGNMTLVDAGIDLGFKLEKLQGGLTGRLAVDPDGTIFAKARAGFESATLAGWQLTKANCLISKQRGSRDILIQDASAEAYAGEAVGSAEITLRKDHAEYQASIVARDVQLGQFLMSFQTTPSDIPAHGLLHGNLILQGRTGADGYREGAGEVFLREAQVWKLPLMLAIFQVLNLTPDENVFHDGWLKYYLSRDMLTFQKIDLQGKALSFIGGGRMDLGSRHVDVTLLAGSPLRLRLPVLTDLLEGASRELMEVRITGTVQKPTILPQPLRGLAKALESVFPEAPKHIGRTPVDAKRP